ncbi:uncharacterized protein NECHADRAFT_81215 [Fusarium vanettenii 77-13-4]|uniref:Protein kinase domain-containing protein n=1 Tax=Fusarium vanettenii (strain ATCC MYA-4622 / CBS 123669 / FGSC 9596 / NRRL 45880 / 77-13-4) TaxID=660122 RepID=C7ZHP9_FUSV7|nr:uncharacterized protein NECHADRAFT_81215 [Fusarium vanettenii 77-13-4]EEU36455.1 hypothetical protein NECHADRAFT_81215 [Fusarium vanettenii 77-13-4]
METLDFKSQEREHLIYSIDQILCLKITLDDSSSHHQTEVLVRVEKFEPEWTFSCGMLVEILPDSARQLGLDEGTQAFLKLFDRRFARSLRKWERVGPWTANIEDEFLHKLKSGDLQDFLGRLHAEEDSEEDDDEDDWDASENEAWLADMMLNYFRAEVATYSALQKHQGDLIPRLFAQVTLQVVQPSTSLDEQQQDTCLVKGILIEYLKGFTLSSLKSSAPRSSWQNIVDQGIRITHVLGDNNILNSDVRPDNMMVVRQGKEEYRVCMIDFGHCRMRREDESDHDWGRAKWCQDEEGAIGVVMRGALAKVGFQLHYENSGRYLEWAPGEDDQ